MKLKVLAREVLLLSDGDDWFRIDCAWGVDPGIAFIPSAKSWDVTVPSWLKGRRQQVVDMITNFGLTVRDDETNSVHRFGTGPVVAPPYKVTATLGPFPIPSRRDEQGESK